MGKRGSIEMPLASLLPGIQKLQLRPPTRGCDNDYLFEPPNALQALGRRHTLQVVSGRQLQIAMRGLQAPRGRSTASPVRKPPCSEDEGHSKRRQRRLLHATCDRRC